MSKWAARVVQNMTVIGLKSLRVYLKKMQLPALYLTCHLSKSADDKSVSPGLHLLTAEVYNHGARGRSWQGKNRRMSKSSHSDHEPKWTRNKSAQEKV